MKIVLPWLRELVEVPAGVERFAETLGLRGFEVADVDPAAEVVDFEVTANRPDCLSHVGFAREACAAFDLPLRQPDSTIQRAAATAETTPTIQIEDPEDCPRYAGQVVRVKVAPSPGWLVDRLQAAGVRSINTVVDATNYVMLELGQPLHAFDFEKLAGRQIRVRRALAGEHLRTLDGELRTLDADMLVIADGERAQALAGVMGGADSEVSGRTALVLLESAYFNARSVRRTSRRLGLKTEASARFERGADPGIQVEALARTCALLTRLGAGEAVGPPIDCHPAPRPPRHVPLRRARIAQVLGFPVTDAEVDRYLRRLGFAITTAPEGWLVAVPTFRVDVTREIDLIEEVGRHAGYDRMPATFPALRRLEAGVDPRIGWDRLAQRVLTAAGFNESQTFSFIERAAADAFRENPDDALVDVANPLSESFAVLRPSLLPGLVDAAAHNRRRERRDVRLFETGTTFSAHDGEVRRVGVVWTGAATSDHWSARPRAVDFFDAKGIVEAACRAFGVEPGFSVCHRPFLVSGRAASVSAAGFTIGLVGQLLPGIAAARGLTGSDEVYVAELSLEALAGLGRPAEDLRVQPVPRHPSVVRDVSIEIDAGLAAAAVRDTIHRTAPATLVSVREFDRYQGEGIPAGRVSLSLRLTFRDPDRTLTDAEVQEAMDAIVAALSRSHGAVRR